MKTTAREKILNSAEGLVAQEGVKRLTIENVAVAAGVSRGGVLYHFASKEALIQAMLDRLIGRFERIIEDEINNDTEEHGRWTRAFVRATLRMDEETSAVFTPLLAAIAYEPDLLVPLRDRQEQWQRATENELDPVTAAVVRLASHALWLNDLFAMNTFDQNQKRAIVARLVEMTRKV
jgi:AcrR family transcriptional regulator